MHWLFWGFFYKKQKMGVMLVQVKRVQRDVKFYILEGRMLD